MICNQLRMQAHANGHLGAYHGARAYRRAALHWRSRPGSCFRVRSSQENGNGGESENGAQPQTATIEEAPAPNLQLPQEVISKLRETVFGYDFFVTGVQNYQANGVIFRGNLRGDPTAAYSKMAARLQEQLGSEYKLFLLEEQDPSKEERPVAVVLPLSAVQPQAPPVNEGLLAAALGATTVLTTLNISGAELFNLVLLTAGFDPEKVAAAVPGTVAFLAILAAHEAGHWVAARQRSVELAPPLLIPAGLGLLGSFGAITRIKSVVPDRAALGAVAAGGPLAGAALSLAVLLAGLALTLSGAGGVEVDSQSFKDSLLMGLVGQAAFGGQLFEAEAVNANPLLVAGWAGLIINALQMVPVGELDGGRTFLALFGRAAAKRISAVSFLVMGLFSFSSGLALYWLLLSLTLQRGVPAPCANEVSGVGEGAGRVAAIAALLLPLLVLLPYPLGGGAELTDFATYGL